MSRFLWLIFPLSILPLTLVAMGGSSLLLALAAAWGTFHVAKQHLGIVMLYKRVNHERDKADFLIDKWFLLASQMLPLALFLLWFLSFPALAKMLGVAITMQALMVSGYLYRQVVKYRAKEQMNWPKLSLLALVIPLHWVAYVCASHSTASGFFVFTIGINIGHALQYHRLTWFHNRNRYQGGSGLAAVLSRRVIYYYAAALGLSLFFVLLGPSFLPFHGTELLLIGPTFMHYVLDSRIWRVREDPDLAKALRLTNTTPFARHHEQVAGTA